MALCDRIHTAALNKRAWLQASHFPVKQGYCYKDIILEEIDIKKCINGCKSRNGVLEGMSDGITWGRKVMYVFNRMFM